MPDGSPAAKPRFRLAIIGGGIAGLTLAVALGRFEQARSPIQVDLYESGPEITTVGAGISVWPRTWAVMRALGLYDQLASQAVKAADGKDDDIKPGFVFRKSDWPREGYEFGRVMVPSGSTTMHRAEMVDILVRNIPASCAVHTSKRLVKYTDSGTSYTLHFADGTKATADVIVGADGIKSKTRAAMYDYAHQRECAKKGIVKKEECERCKKAVPKWTGTIAYRYLIPSESLREIEPKHHALECVLIMLACMNIQHIITYPISHGKYLNFVGFVTIPDGEGTVYPHKWVRDAKKEDILSAYSGWEPEVDQMLSCVEKPTIWAIHVMEDLPFSVYGKVAIIGDAVHAMTTHFGAGGGQAIEDAYILGRWLADPQITLSRVPDVLRIYQDVRLPFARKVVRDAGKAGLMYEFNYPGLYDGSPISASSEEQEVDLLKKPLDELGEAIRDLWRWQWEEKVDLQWDVAEARYLEVLKGGRAEKVKEKGEGKTCVIM
ncbi:hypothetical protein BD310DRAFT_1010505 [Dichomitus squalens]|uniref:FAD-binding domain-containing protein n=1 Tax=Dichomitus squalens TaxID=114155 RepID=A0A4Q9PXK3_9APHY|nr:hypothetical protein BD310DRAFT_1010505 [Dichomitus squalens]